MQSTVGKTSWDTGIEQILTTNEPLDIEWPVLTYNLNQLLSWEAQVPLAMLGFEEKR